MAHSQKSIRDHTRRRNQPNIDNSRIAQQLEDLVKPCAYNQLAYYRSLEMRSRILSLPLMLAAVLSLLWRQVPYDQLIRLGTGYQGNPILNLRLVEVKHGSTWYRYLTSVREPEVLPPYIVADLYARRWSIEETFGTLKRLLGLSYLWTGSVNGIELQLWATWLFYVVLIDLADEVASELAIPFEDISVEMVFRGLYHFSVAYEQGKATDPVAYLTAPENQDLAVVKAPRASRKKPPLDLSAFPQPEGLTNCYVCLTCHQWVLGIRVIFSTIVTYFIAPKNK